MARIIGAFGIKGWVKIQPASSEPRSLLEYPQWWVGGADSWQPCSAECSEVHGREIVAKLAGCEDRDAAARLRGREIAVPRSAFPPAADNEYYWADLVGLKVVNKEGVDLGRVSRVIETGANDVLVVEGERERLLPFIEQVVQEVDLAARVMRVDWGADY